MTPPPEVTGVPATAVRAPRRVAFMVAVVALLAWSVAVAGAGSDINGDGFDDLAVGVPDEEVAQVDEAGVVNILRGGSAGVRAARDVVLSQADLGGTVEAVDRFGNAITYGDFNGDGFDDVAVGAPTEDFAGKENAGVVHIIYGSTGGADRRNTQLVSQVGKMAGKNETGDFFGTVLAAGNINGDAYDDLIIGVAGEDVAGKVAAGAVVVAYGGRKGIRTRGSQLITERGKVPGIAEDFDAFGVALAVGDFNADGFDDVAVGAPAEGVEGQLEAGKVTILYGRAEGLDKAGAVLFAQTNGVPGGNEAGDSFGNVLTAGDFNGDGFDDVAVGIPGEDLDGGVDAGAVVVLNGGESGISAAAAQLLTQESGPLGGSEEGDEFGRALAAGDFNGDNYDDLAVGSPNEGIGAFADVGRVAVFPGSGAGLDGAAVTDITQAPLPKAKNEAGDQLGASLRTGDFDNDDIDDLVIASPFEDVRTKRDSGMIYIVYGSNPGGLDVAGASRFHQGTRNVEERAEAGDLFGVGL